MASRPLNVTGKSALNIVYRLYNTFSRLLSKANYEYANAYIAQ